MSIGVQSYPELYTMLLGWQLYDQVWALLSQTGLAYLPFIGLLLRNFEQPYTSQEAKDAATTSMRRMEINLIVMLLLVFFGVSPVFSLDPTLVSYTPACQTDGQNTYHPGDTGTTYDQAFTVPTGDIRVPMWWYAVMAMSEGMTSGANTLVACVPDLRKMVTQVNMTAITEPELKQEVRQFEQDCFIPARTQYLADTHTNSATLTPISTAVDEYGVEDTEWAGSHGYTQTYYQTLHASAPVKGFPYDPSQDMNADTNADNPPAYSTPTCNLWWNDSQNGLKTRLYKQLPLNFQSEYQSILGNPNVQDDVLKRLVFHDSGYSAASNNIGDISYSHLATALGTWFQGLKEYPKIYAAAQAAPIIQSLLLLMVYAFLPLALVFTGYKPSSFITGAIMLFSLIFWPFIWHLVSWTDSALMMALYGDNWFAQHQPNAVLVDMITGILIIGAPLFWFSFMGSMGVAVGNIVATFTSLNAPAFSAAKQGSDIINTVAKTTGKVISKL